MEVRLGRGAEREGMMGREEVERIGEVCGEKESRSNLFLFFCLRSFSSYFFRVRNERVEAKVGKERREGG